MTIGEVNRMPVQPQGTAVAQNCKECEREVDTVEHLCFCLGVAENRKRTRLGENISSE